MHQRTEVPVSKHHLHPIPEAILMLTAEICHLSFGLHLGMWVSALLWESCGVGPSSINLWRICDSLLRTYRNAEWRDKSSTTELHPQPCLLACVHPGLFPSTLCHSGARSDRVPSCWVHFGRFTKCQFVSPIFKMRKQRLSGMKHSTLSSQGLTLKARLWRLTLKARHSNFWKQ